MRINNLCNILIKVICLFLCFCPLISIGQKSQHLYFYAEKGNVAQEGILTKFKNVSRIYMFYENFFIKGAKFDKSLFNSFCAKLIPNRNEFGYAVLDWEGEEFDILRGVKKVSDQRYKVALNRYIEIIQYAKKTRPNIFWSFYDCNPAQYPIVNKSGEFNYKKLAPLLNEVDFFSTSLYLRDNFSENSRISDYLTSNVIESLKLGKIYGKMVLPFIWHRYHDAKKSNHLIAKPDFNKYVQHILHVKFGNLKVDGVIWWNSESYIYRMKKQRISYQKEYSKVTDVQYYQETLFKDYINVLSKILIIK